MDGEALLGGLSPERFLGDYWQKRPLLIRQAFAALPAALAPDELAGLACEPEVESRLVLQERDSGSWRLRHGPFDEASFAALPASHWTLLVQDVEKHCPELAAVLEPFRFVPDWRIDDLMVSYAAPAGSVGPHLDRYDVFLIQALGRRRWQVEFPAPARERLLPDCELRILEHFQPSQEWVLEPGDMLYLPPGVPHHGVALEACMTYSVGFRAPSYQELVAGYLDERLAALDPALRYSDPELRPQGNPTELTPAALARLRQVLREQLARSDAQLDEWLGRFLTEPKPGFADKGAGQALAPPALAAWLQERGPLRWNPASRIALLRPADGRGVLFADGEAYSYPAELWPLVDSLARHRHLAQEDLPGDPEPALVLLSRLYNDGHLIDAGR